MSVSRLEGSGDSPAQRFGKGKSDQGATERFSRPTFLVSDKQGEYFKPHHSQTGQKRGAKTPPTSLSRSWPQA